MKIGRYTYTLRRTSVPAVSPSPRATKDAKDAKADPQKQHKPLEEEEPCTPKRRALLIGISYSGADTRVKEDGYGELRGPHADVAAMRRLLVGRYGYKEEDVVVLLDGEEGGTLQPTRVNILQAIDDLVRDARKGDRFFFHYCGHTTQIENRSNSEEDGMDECLVPIDGEPNKIMDNELRLHLVAALPVGSSLVAVFDSCHSASLLDLAHFRCNRVYVPWLSKGRRRSDDRWNAVVRKHALPFLPLSKSKPPSRSGTGTVNANHTRSPPLSRSGTMNTANNARSPPLSRSGTMNARSPPLSRSGTMNTNAPPLPAVAPIKHKETETEKRNEEGKEKLPRKPKRKATKREKREAREVMALQMIEGGVGAPASASRSSSSAGRKVQANGKEEGIKEEEEPEELVPTRPNTPVLPSPSSYAHAHGGYVHEYGYRTPMVTTRRIYEAARTGTGRVKAWRTEVDALEVGYDEDDELASSGFSMGEEERGEGEGGKRLARAGTEGEVQVRGGKKREREYEHKAGREENKNKGTKLRKRASLPLPLVPLRLGSLSFSARGKQAKPTAQGETRVVGEDEQQRKEKQDKGKGKGTDKTPTTTTERRTTVARARAVSVAVRPDAGAIVDGHGHGHGAEKENATPAPGPSGRPTLRLAVPREEGEPQEDGQREAGARPVSWLGEEGDAEGRACESPAPVWVCTGFACREEGHGHGHEGEQEEKAEVISLASCKDHQISWEDASGGSMTRELVRILERDPHPTLRSLVTNVSHALHRMSLERHLETLRYKRAIKTYNKLVLEQQQRRNATAAGSATRGANAHSQTTVESTLAPVTPGATAPVSRASSRVIAPVRVSETEDQRVSSEMSAGAKEGTDANAENAVRKPTPPQAKAKTKAKSEGFVEIEPTGTYDMDNFQDPQVASHRPLDMERPWSM